jgi:hypothetical protein
LGLERNDPLVIGPVTILTRAQWLESVNFAPEAIGRYVNAPEKNAHWKETVNSALENPSAEVDMEGLAGNVYSAIKDCRAVLKIAVAGYEQDLSRKVAQIVSKSALDALSMLLGGKDFFHQQILADERMQPIQTSGLLETDGQLWIPGMSFGKRVGHINLPRAKEYLAKNSGALTAIEHIVSGLLDPARSKHPNLCKRWTTALDWLAEGTRENNDAVALAKIASSLDVLACGGKFSGILKMLVHLTSIPAEHVIVNGESPRTLRQVVKDIYDNGRSQILHGTHFDRLISFEAWRNYAAQLARLALIESALRLDRFVGPDEDKQFNTMPSV